ncbi:MAG: hypothetical protein ABFD10_00080 [Prolixibacteraceae bacterium]
MEIRKRIGHCQFDELNRDLIKSFSKKEDERHTRKGKKKQEYLYWEFSGGGGQYAIRMDNWEGVKRSFRKSRQPMGTLRFG